MRCMSSMDWAFMKEIMYACVWKRTQIRYDTKRPNGMNHIHDNKEKIISEWNLLHDILNLFERTKNINIHCYPIPRGCLNTQKGKARFKNFRILLGIGCSSRIVMIMLIENLSAKKGSVMQWHTQAGNITTNLKDKIYFNLPELSATKIVMWNCYVDASDKSRHYMILGQDLLTALR